MTTIMIGKALATVTENEILTSGMINAKIKFVFSDDWYPALSKTAIFTAGDVTKVVLDSYWENNVCSIPQECLAKSDEILMVGIYGADNANVVAIPTVWATVGKIRKGYEGYEDVSTGTLPIWAQVQSAAAQSATAAKNAQDAAEMAQGKAEDAQAAAEAAQAKAETAQSKAETAQSKAETAQGKAESAQSAAESAAASASGSASAAASSASAAALSEDASAEYEAGAKTAAASAAANGKLSESWAVGGTGTRTGEDTNNAKYWAMAAHGAAGGGVSSFNGRSGAVAPQIGDYTAEMVGADEQGAAQTVQGNLNTHAQNTTVHISATERTAWNAKANAADLTSHVDDAEVHVTATEKAEWNSKVGKSTKVNLTLYASSWSTEKKYTVSNANITATSAVELLPRENNGITQAQMEALSGAMIVGGTQAAGSIQLVALGDKPTTDIPVTLIIRRDL